MLKYQKLSKIYPGPVTAVDELNLEIPKGEVFALLGANGAGKTTTIMLTLGFIRPSAGKIIVDGIDVEKNPVKAKDKVAYVSENVSLYGNFSAYQNIRFFCKLSGESPTRDDMDKILDRVGLISSARDRRVKTYSKGMRQRAGLAIAVLKKAPLIIMDEPMSGLDPKGANDFIEIIHDLRREGFTVFMSTHDIFRAKGVADSIGIMNRGRLVHLIKKEELDEIDLEKLYIQAVSTD